jgi:hypothetical protein
MTMRAIRPGSPEAAALGFDKADPSPVGLNLAAFKKHADRPALQTRITLPFADGEYAFDLPLAQIKELERSAQCGIAAVYGRVSRGRLLFANGSPDFAQIDIADPFNASFMESDVLDTIRLGLIGGGGGVVDGEEVRVGPTRAQELVVRYVIGQPLADAWMIAFAVLGARMHGVAVPVPAPVEAQ